MKLFNRDIKVLQNMKIQTKLPLSFFLFVALICVIGGVSLLSINQIQNKFGIISDVSLPLVNASNNLIGDINKFHITTLDLLDSEDTEDVLSQMATLGYLEKKFLTNMENLSKTMTKGADGSAPSALTTRPAARRGSSSIPE